MLSRCRATGVTSPSPKEAYPENQQFLQLSNPAGGLVAEGRESDGLSAGYPQAPYHSHHICPLDLFKSLADQDSSIVSQVN